jgi:predicted N-acetyltransferase YhbS
MKQRVITHPDFVIRSPETVIEENALFLLNAQAFYSDEETERVAERRRNFVVNDPEFDRTHMRGAFLSGKCIGGYFLFERVMSIRSAHLQIGRIYGLVTHPDYRNQGIATALMNDALSIAQSRKYTLLLLHGIPNFYHFFGYVDVMEDLPHHFILRKYIPEEISNEYTVCHAEPKDALSVLALYQRHYSSYLASFAPARTDKRQIHLLSSWVDANEAKPLVAIHTSSKKIHGYLLLSQRRNKWYAYEAAAENWPATLALLQAHANLLAEVNENSPYIWWPLPSCSQTFYLLADHLPIRSELISWPDRGWMARLVHVPTLIKALIPAWQERWQQRPRYVNWEGSLALAVENHTTFLHVTSEIIQIVDRSYGASSVVNFSASQFARLMFGFRPIAQIVNQLEQQVPAELILLFGIFFPPDQAYIARSDFF